MSLELQNVSASYHGGAPIIEGLSMQLYPGEMLGVLGPNGAGKSTLIKLLARTLAPLTGAVLLGGRPLTAFGRFELAREVAVVEQSPATPAGFTVREVVTMGRAPHLGLFGAPGRADHEAVEGALEATGTLRLAGRNVETLSGGEAQRVIFARALAQEPRFLLLDEPTSHLDLKFQVELLTHARRQARAGTGVLVVAHDLNLAARSCDRLIVLSEGELVTEGAPQEVLTEELIRDVYGARVRVLEQVDAPVVVPLF